MAPSRGLGAWAAPVQSGLYGRAARRLLRSPSPRLDRRESPVTCKHTVALTSAEWEPILAAPWKVGERVISHYRTTYGAECGSHGSWLARAGC